MKVKAQTQYTKDLLLKFARFNALRMKSQIVAYGILELIMLGIVGFGIHSAMTLRGTEDIIFAAIFTVVLPFLVPLIIYLLPILMARASRNLIGARVAYEFSDHEIHIESNLPEVKGQTKGNYTMFQKVYETQDAFYLFIAAKQALLLDKSDISEGGVAVLQNLLKKNMSAQNYIVKHR
jgi:hypothetical protein